MRRNSKSDTETKKAEEPKVETQPEVTSDPVVEPVADVPIGSESIEELREMRTAPKLGMLSLSNLRGIAQDAREAASLITDPTNVFARRYAALAEAAETLHTLITERGHTGVNND